MNGTAIASGRSRWLVVLAVAALAAFTLACGGDDSSETAESGDSAGGSSPTISSGSSPTATTSSGGAISNSVDCGALAEVAGFSGFGLELDVLSVSTPNSDLGREVSGFFTSTLEDALGTSVSRNCYYELKIIGEPEALWMSFELSSPPGSDATSEISAELTSRGVPVNSSLASTGSVIGENFSFIGFDGLPDIEGGVGGLVFVTDSNVLVVVGEEFGEASEPPSTGGGSSGQGSSSSGSPPIAVSAEGVVAEVEAVLRPWLENVVRANLTLTSNFTSLIGLDTTATLIYEGDSPPIPDIARMEQGVVSFGARLDSALQVGPTASVVFSNAEIAGHLVSGTITVAEVVTLLILIAN